MKLIKIKDNTFDDYYYYIIETVDSTDRYRRTIRLETIIDCINSVRTNHEDLCSSVFTVVEDEELIFEIEFNEFDDLLEIIPEEFL